MQQLCNFCIKSIRAISVCLLALFYSGTAMPATPLPNPYSTANGNPISGNSTNTNPTQQALSALVTQTDNPPHYRKKPDTPPPVQERIKLPTPSTNARQYKPVPPYGHPADSQANLDYAYTKYTVSTDRAYNKIFRHEDVQKTIIPFPRRLGNKTQTLSLEEAIILSLRNNPDVQNDELQRVLDKYQLALARWAFQPHYTLTGTTLWQNGQKPTYSLTPGVQVETPIGTTVGLGYNQNFKGGPGVATLNITQPLLRDFGLGRLDLADANTNELVARLNYKQNIMNAVNQIITGYLNLVQEYDNLTVQENTLKSTIEATREAELRVKAGKIAPSELYNEKATLETTKLGVLQSKNQIASDYQNFLNLLGLNADAKVQIDKKLNLTTIKVPELQNSIKVALRHNTQYQTALLQVENDKRAVIRAENQARWQINLVASANEGEGGTVLTPGSSGATQITPGQRNIGLNFDIPIDDLNLKSAIVSAKVALQQAQNSLAQTHRQVVHDVTEQIQQLELQKQQITTSIKAAELQYQAYNSAKIKHQYGKATVFEVTTLQNEALAAQIQAIIERIGFVTQMTTLDNELGQTLNRWHIRLRY